ncbi:unnamed protein product [Paramecium pentaurelia]|uniref:Uncharacterized protein n=1 Tax=Paramecium pentaurelia TaxID=43138 RepID=A0A8S1UPF1_9CILI|nr:unnamed protein product [Paramecium pentaurelia]CAD8164328.1 unnamed protein product [Paramecium pentaurelia]CAD8164336.1 unnamed protein product [Paramecium pentaurelia]
MSEIDPITIKLVVVGDGNVGKTCILLSYTTDKFPQDYVPTVFENYTTQTAVDGKMINLSLWDTAGQETYNRLRTLSYNSADVFLVVFSVIEESSFENAIIKWYPELEAPELKCVPKIFVGNKIDMRNQANPSHVQQEAAKSKVEKLQCQYLECSALTQIGLKEIFDQAIKKAIKVKILKSQNQTLQNVTSTIQKDQKPSNEEKCCCSTF